MYHAILLGLGRRAVTNSAFLVGALARRDDAPQDGVDTTDSNHHGMDDTLKKAIDTLLDDFWWWFVLLVVNVMIFTPVCIYLSYSVSNLWPVLAIVEDEAPPSYERIALAEDDENNEKDDDVESTQQRPVTAGIKSLNAMLYRIDGWPSLLRGLRPHMLLNFSIVIVGGILAMIPYFPSFCAIAIAPLASVQLYTGWIHIAISPPSEEPFWRRLPSFRSAFRATALPTFTCWLALAIAQELPLWVMHLMKVVMWDPTGTSWISVPRAEGSVNDIWKILAVFAAWFLPMVFLVTPAHMVLTRVQASMLPAHEECIVSFDRTFGLERNKEGGRSEAISMLDAWRTFSRAAWMRLIKLYIKTTLITLAVEAVLVTLLAVDLILLMHSMSSRDN